MGSLSDVLNSKVGLLVSLLVLVPVAVPVGTWIDVQLNNPEDRLFPAVVQRLLSIQEPWARESIETAAMPLEEVEAADEADDEDEVVEDSHIVLWDPTVLKQKSISPVQEDVKMQRLPERDYRWVKK